MVPPAIKTFLAAGAILGRLLIVHQLFVLVQQPLLQLIVTLLLLLLLLTGRVARAWWLARGGTD